MNLVILTSSLGTGGAERVASTLANAWSARGDRITLMPTFSGGGKSFYSLSEKVELIFLADRVGNFPVGNKKRYLLRLFALRKLILEKKPDVVVSFLPNVNVAAILACAGTGIPVVVGERSDPTQHPISQFWSVACKASYRFADSVTVQTQSVARSIHSLYGGLRQVAIVPNPITEEVVSCRADFDVKRSRKVLLSMGRLVKEKRVDQIISAFSAVAGEYPDWDLHIYGDGPLEAQLHQQVLPADLSKRVVFKGRSANPWAVMAQADAFVMASAFEGFPNALLEAMAVGLPCVATDCLSGPAEITRDGQDALLVGVGNVGELQAALLRLMEDERLRYTLGAQARESVLARYSLANVLQRWDDIFASVGVRR